jgi:hypothetical protein
MNRVLLKIFGPKGEKVAGGWGKLHNEELHNLYDSLNIIKSDHIKENEMGGSCSTNGGDEKHVQNFGRKS